MAGSGNNESGKDVVHAGVHPSLVNFVGADRVKEYMRRDAEHISEGNRDWTSSLLPHISLVAASSAQPHPKLVFAYTVQAEHCNRLGNLHGGCAATLFDFLTTMVLTQVNSPGFWWFLGVSRTLNVTYLRPMPLDQTFHFECEIVHVGKRLAALKGTAKRPSDGAVMAICEHGKVNTDPPMGKI
ncbi:hypothetical protein GQ53DRAFT_689479 [Thozetella sp. PMI_491]|nr:hypothetical protein GQ53DRAFT_689479 [Thozetella sp. PMI_491]